MIALLMVMLLAANGFVVQQHPFKGKLRALTIEDEEQKMVQVPKGSDKKKLVLVSGFESFNMGLYEECGRKVSERRPELEVVVVSDRELRSPVTESALADADAVIVSLIFDYDDVEWLQPQIKNIETRLVFESATELMALNRLGRFQMGGTGESTPSGPPPAVKAVLSKFSSGREEDKMQGYLQMLKVGPELLKWVPGTGDLKTWLEAYRYWNEGGPENVANMFELLHDRCFKLDSTSEAAALKPFPAIGFVDSDMNIYETADAFYAKTGYQSNKPVVALLLYRKHVATRQSYIGEMIRALEDDGMQPLPIFITGVEAHTVIRDMIRTRHQAIDKNKVLVDAVINTIGFPLVGGPAGSMQAGRDPEAAAKLLQSADVPYSASGPLLLQNMADWKQRGVSGLQSVVFWALPELDAATDAVVLGGLDTTQGEQYVALDKERVSRLAGRIKRKIVLSKLSNFEKRIAVLVYGYPPGVGAVGTAALLNVPKSLDALIAKMKLDNYDLGEFVPSGEAIVAALALIQNRGPSHLLKSAERAYNGDPRVAEALAEIYDPETSSLRKNGFELVAEPFKPEYSLSVNMQADLEACWPPRRSRPTPANVADNTIIGLRIGKLFLAVQPLLGFEGDPMGLLFGGKGNSHYGARLTPHPQYVNFYRYLQKETDAVLCLGTHGTVEWLPGQPLGNDANSWPDALLGDLPHLYVYAVNNPAEAILAKRRAYATLVSHAIPGYDRSGLYLDLAALKDDLDEFLEGDGSGSVTSLLEAAEKCGLLADVPLIDDKHQWARDLSTYLVQVRQRLFSTGLHVLGQAPEDEDALLAAYFSDLEEEDRKHIIKASSEPQARQNDLPLWQQQLNAWIQSLFPSMTSADQLNAPPSSTEAFDPHLVEEARLLRAGLRATSNEITNLVEKGLSARYLPPGPGGDVLRDGAGVLPTGRNMYALDPYRMPSKQAFVRGQKLAYELAERHRDQTGTWPETVSVALWGLDAIKTRGESVAIAVALAGGRPVRDLGGRVVRFEAIPLDELGGRPRIDVLCTLSGIFRDSFENVVLLLDDFFDAVARLDEPISLNYVRKHALASIADDNYENQESKEIPASASTRQEMETSRLFSNPAGDYGSLVSDAVVSGEWEESSQLGDTWASRNAYAYGRSSQGTAKPKALDNLLATTDLVVQELDSVEYGITDIQEYHANTGALKKAAETRRADKTTIKVALIEAFTSGDDRPVRDLDETLRLEYRTKLLNPKWSDMMIKQGAGGAFEISQRMTAALGWAATNGVDDFVFDQAAERYALNEDMANKLQKANPEAFKNIVSRLLEVHARGLWNAEDKLIDSLRELYSDADDAIEGIV